MGLSFQLHLPPNLFSSPLSQSVLQLWFHILKFVCHFICIEYHSIILYLLKFLDFQDRLKLLFLKPKYVHLGWLHSGKVILPWCSHIKVFYFGHLIIWNTSAKEEQRCLSVREGQDERSGKSSVNIVDIISVWNVHINILKKS